jgi:hypothetical protein
MFCGYVYKEHAAALYILENTPLHPLGVVGRCQHKSFGEENMERGREKVSHVKEKQKRERLRYY